MLTSPFVSLPFAPRLLQTTIHATFPTTDRLFLSPLRVALRSWLIEAKQRGELGQVLELEMLKGAMERVDEVVGSRSSEQ